MRAGLDRLAPESIKALNREVVHERRRIRAILTRLRDEKIALSSGVSARNRPRTARISSIHSSTIQLITQDFDCSEHPQIFFRFLLDGCEYFFDSLPASALDGSEISVGIPVAIHRAERRRLPRTVGSDGESSLGSVRFVFQECELPQARIFDRSLNGIGLQLSAKDATFLPKYCELVIEESDRQSWQAYAQVRHKSQSALGEEWVRVGMSLSQIEFGSPLKISKRERILERSLLAEVRKRRWNEAARQRIQSGGETDEPRSGADRFIPIHDYKNQRGEPLRAIIDSWGNQQEAVAVVIPPAWGRTKETLSPLALTILETFRNARLPVKIVRFDGTNRLGESYIDPECRHPGDEHLHFKFSQAVRDIESTLDFLYSDSLSTPKATILVTFSLASIEGRRAVASDSNGRIQGWVSVVGMADLQSGLRAISGGVDYGYGLLAGIRFGRNELLGVVADMDRTGSDAVMHGLAFLEDARRDMAAIRVPITWIHGRHDAWIDIGQVAEVMSCGDAKHRKLLEVPTGHQLRESREALQTFQLIAEEIGQMATGTTVASVLPPLDAIERRGDLERGRLPAPTTDIKGFWADYLLGRDRRVGMELLTGTAAYQEFVESQIQVLKLNDGARIADLGCGLGELYVQLCQPRRRLGKVRVDLVDYVPEVIRRTKTRIRRLARPGSPLGFVVLNDLDPRESRKFAMKSETYDAVLASLVITYLFNPREFLAEVFRILKPGGRFVLSGLKRDADISKLYVDGMAELDWHTAQQRFGVEVAAELDTHARSFLNEAARLLQIEEARVFRFLDGEAMRDAVLDEGFSGVQVGSGLGDPPQAIIVSAQRPLS